MAKFDELYPVAIVGGEPEELLVKMRDSRPCTQCTAPTQWLDLGWNVDVPTCSKECQTAAWNEFFEADYDSHSMRNGPNQSYLRSWFDGQPYIDELADRLAELRRLSAHLIVLIQRAGGRVKITDAELAAIDPNVPLQLYRHKATGRTTLIFDQTYPNRTKEAVDAE